MNDDNNINDCSQRVKKQLQGPALSEEFKTVACFSRGILHSDENEEKPSSHTDEYDKYNVGRKKHIPKQ